jgi:hypothetical protein
MMMVEINEETCKPATVAVESPLEAGRCPFRGRLGGVPLSDS